MSIDISDISKLSLLLGKPLGTSNWHIVDQSNVDAFGQITGDLNPLHMNPEWAKQHSPFGATIAHGFLTLSMLSTMLNDILPQEGSDANIFNYGFDRVRMMSPVKVGSRIRGKALLKDLRSRKDGSTIVSIEIEVDIEGERKPALTATWLLLVFNRVSQS